MKKRTWEEQEAELEYIQKVYLRIIKVLASHGTDDAYDLFKAQHAARKLLPIIERRERTDRCYYCGSQKRELGTQASTGLAQCIKCGNDEEMERYQSVQKEYWRKKEMGG